jgi:hypothetical protein
MRLFDIVSQSTSSPPGTPVDLPIPAPCHFAETVRRCPLRIVLADELVRCATTLAYSDGDRLAGCLDLIHAPMETVWVEWTESTRHQALREVPNLDVRGEATAKRVGVLVQSDRSGRVGTMRTFWSTPNDVAYLGCLVSEFDLDTSIRESTNMAAIFDGQPVGISYVEEPAVDAVLNHVQYRLDPAWGLYYRCAALAENQRSAVMRAVLASSAFDASMIFALFLLMAAKDGVQRRVSELARINRARQRAGRTPLLEHVEACLNLRSVADSVEQSDSTIIRRPARMHHVRGHLTRRGNKIFWRSSHLRGSARQGLIRTRTVSLSRDP